MCYFLHHEWRLHAGWLSGLRLAAAELGFGRARAVTPTPFRNLRNAVFRNVAERTPPLRCAAGAEPTPAFSFALVLDQPILRLEHGEELPPLGSSIFEFANEPLLPSASFGSSASSSAMRYEMRSPGIATHGSA